MTAGELRDLIIRQLAQTHGGGSARWRRAVAQVKSYPRATHPHCNWEVRAAGTAHEIELVERAVDAMRTTHAIVAER